LESAVFEPDFLEGFALFSEELGYCFEFGRKAQIDVLNSETLLPPVVRFQP